MKVLSRRDIKETILLLAEELDLDSWETNSDLQQYLKCGEILKIKYLSCTWNDEYTYEYRIKYLELN
jgi:hypothetical protein